MVERETGRRNIEYLNECGLTAPNVLLAHCVHLNKNELEILSRTGTHVAHLWTNTGTLLATATFVNEAASGWQEVMFASPDNVRLEVVYIGAKAG